MNKKKSNFEYKLAYGFPDKLEKLIEQHMHGDSLNVPCGMSKLGNLRVDHDPSVDPDIVWDMWDLPNYGEFKNRKFDTIISDPLWNMAYGKRQQFGYLLRSLLKPNGTLIFNAPWVLHIKNLECQAVYYRVGYVTWANTALVSIYRKLNEELIL